MSDGSGVYELDGQRGVTPAVRWLLAGSIGLYFLQLTLFGTGNVSDLLALSDSTFPDQWWTPLSYMFVHASLLHLALNMFTLWMFGPRLERAWSTRSFTYFYIWCGLGGAVFHLLFARGSAVVGASAAIVGVVLAYALRWPDDELYLFGVLPVKARWLALWLIAVNVGMALASVAGLGGGSTTAWVAHAGGLAFAWLYLHAPSGASLERIRQQVSTIPDESDTRPIPRVQRARRREKPEESSDEVVARSNAVVQRRPTLPAVIAPVLRHPPDTDALLDKISHHGLDSLTREERRALEEASRRMRGSGSGH